MLDKSRLQIFGNLSILHQEIASILPANLPEVIAKRTTPGILIFTSTKDLVYINAEAHEALVAMQNPGNGAGTASAISIPESITTLCDQLKNMVSSYRIDSPVGLVRTPSVIAVSANESEAYSFRAFFLSNNIQTSQNDGAYILVLIERVSLTKKLNLQKAFQRYKLSKREAEVVNLLILGHKNKEMAEKLCVCVYTIEDHIKNIMKKMGVSNRTSILAKLLEA
jgi:DNA-binding CsgD family transcriptional regulator